MNWLAYLVDYGIIGLLIVLSVVSLAVFIERYLFFRQLVVDNRAGDRKTFEIEITKGWRYCDIGSNARRSGFSERYWVSCLFFYDAGGYVSYKNHDRPCPCAESYSHRTRCGHTVHRVLQLSGPKGKSRPPFVGR